MSEDCLTADTLSEYWRLDRNGSEILGGGPSADSSGRACDLGDHLGWFRFGGAAGKFTVYNATSLYLCIPISP